MTPAGPTPSGLSQDGQPSVMATEYTVSCIPEDSPDHRHFRIYVVRRAGSWMVWDGYEPGQYLDADRIWSFRDGTDGWWDAHRFDLDAALDLAKREAPDITVNGLSVEDALRRMKGARA